MNGKYAYIGYKQITTKDNTVLYGYTLLDITTGESKLYWTVSEVPGLSGEPHSLQDGTIVGEAQIELVEKTWQGKTSLKARLVAFEVTGKAKLVIESQSR